jgi:hypothetical protein
MRSPAETNLIEESEFIRVRIPSPPLTEFLMENKKLSTDFSPKIRGALCTSLAILLIGLDNNNNNNNNNNNDHMVVVPTRFEL